MPPRFAPALAVASTRGDGSLVLRSPMPLAPPPRSFGDMLAHWASRAPTRTFLAERDSSGAWSHLTYKDALHAVRAVAQALLDRGARVDRPVILLSDNSVDHAIVQLAAMHVGVAAAPISPAYSLLSRDFAKLRAITALLRPSVVFAENGDAFEGALAAMSLGDTPIVVSDRPPKNACTMHDIRSTLPTAAVDRAFGSLTPDTIAKVLFTSGSTGAPKGVVNTQRMITSNQQQIQQLWPFLKDRPPIVVDWLPWSHTFGGNHNFGIVLMNGGTLYVDRGKPAPGRIETTVRNLGDVSPTLYFNVPRGFDMLLPFLESDDDLRATFFRDLDLVFYAAAALPQHLWERLERVAARERELTEAKLTMVAAWGSTETSPLLTSVHFPIPRAGVIGLPAPGCALAFVPHGEKREMRVTGPNITPGYWEAGGTVRPLALDDEGFLPTGDAGKLEDDSDPSKGVVFDGRIAENFKLSSGTWVSVGETRVAIVAACAPFVQDAVIAGHDRDALGILLFPTPALTALGADAARMALRSKIADYNCVYSASSTRVARAVVLGEPASIDDGEITDKGYVNQRAVLTRRASYVERLYATPCDRDVIALD